MKAWQTTRFSIDLTTPRVMGVVNVTPDSFSDGGSHFDAQAAVAHCERLVREGADLLDIGGESSRPGALPVPATDEWRRLQPVLVAALTLGVPVSVDTCKADVMQPALDLGVDIINDIRALTAPPAIDLVVSHRTCGVCLMHMRGEPATMQRDTRYADVIAEVTAFLRSRVEAVVAAGVGRQRVVIDPGIGFGKSVADNFALLRGQHSLLAIGQPLLVGWSRKSSLGAATGRAIGDRVAASVAAAVMAVERGASIVRVHDVAATVDALKVWSAVAGTMPSTIRI